jgi:VanZ family protein
MILTLLYARRVFCDPDPECRRYTLELLKGSRLIDRAGINDKVEHFTDYAVLAALPSLDRFRCRRLRATIASLFLLGALLELAQLFSPGRTCDWHDLLADSCGILAGVVLVRVSSLAFRLHFSPAPPAN